MTGAMLEQPRRQLPFCAAERGQTRSLYLLLIQLENFERGLVHKWKKTWYSAGLSNNQKAVVQHAIT